MSPFEASLFNLELPGKRGRICVKAVMFLILNTLIYQTAWGFLRFVEKLYRKQVSEKIYATRWFASVLFCFEQHNLLSIVIVIVIGSGSLSNGSPNSKWIQLKSAFIHVETLLVMLLNLSWLGPVQFLAEPKTFVWFSCEETNRETSVDFNNRTLFGKTTIVVAFKDDSTIAFCHFISLWAYITSKQTDLNVDALSIL